MLPSPLSRRGPGRLVRAVVAAALGLMPAACAGSDGQELTATSRERIVGGTLAPVAASPVVMVAGPEGVCSGVLVAVNLLVTARHCAAQFTEGALECTASGELAPGSPGGAIGADDTPSDMHIFMAADAPTTAAAAAQGTPDAVGKQILSTESPSGCRDDLSFVVLDRSLPVIPVPVRIDRDTDVGESVSVWGYGQTANVGDPAVLRVYDAAQIVAVGPSVATTLSQLAPVRSVRVGDGAITCDGDSGGPILSKETGALVAVVSIGSLPVAGGGCAATGESPTTGPRMAEYHDLVLQAFAAAGADPNLEAPIQDAAPDTDVRGAGAESGALPDTGARATGDESGTVPGADGSNDAPGAPGAPSFAAAGGCTASPRGGGTGGIVAPVFCVALLGGVRRARSRERSRHRVAR